MTNPVFEGRWSSGENASVTDVSVEFTADGLSILDAGGVSFALWLYADLRPAAPVSAKSGDALLRNARMPRATLFIRGAGAGAAVLERAPKISENYKRFKAFLYGLGATALVAVAGAFLFFGNLSLSKTVAAFIPPDMADRLGAQNVEMFNTRSPKCGNQGGNAAIQRLLDQLEKSGDYGRPFKLHVVRFSVANAFALPGRHIVLLSGLLKQAKSPEEVAGVLAHEMGHGLEKDPEALFVRAIGLQTLVSFLTGEGGGGQALTFGALLLQLRYSREAERLADAHAIEILRNARIDAKPTADFFLRHADGPAGDGGVASYLSTHPSSKERAQLFLSQAKLPARRLLSGAEWAAAQAVCDGEDSEHHQKIEPEKRRGEKPVSL